MFIQLHQYKNYQFKKINRINFNDVIWYTSKPAFNHHVVGRKGNTYFSTSEYSLKNKNDKFNPLKEDINQEYIDNYQFTPISSFNAFDFID